MACRELGRIVEVDELQRRVYLQRDESLGTPAGPQKVAIAEDMTAKVLDGLGDRGHGLA